MKGLVFTEFMEMVESKFDMDMVDTLIDNTSPASGGCYTAVGSYDFQELENMLIELSRQTGLGRAQLMETFGRHLASVFTEKYAGFFIEAGSSLALFKQIDKHIHVEVKKLYPDAELPEFSYEEANECAPFKLHYRSQRDLSMLAFGLINATIEYYSESFDVYMQQGKDGDKHICTFTLTPCAYAA
uniref:heme NO-binding domain-containing protein n=1 Tax=Ningiella ruwaisensis TaxID=2364274 RepID=UPI00109FFF76|nr:heme NO-binding domain-containing protein [Ningiella ruwaisensis]